VGPAPPDGAASAPARCGGGTVHSCVGSAALLVPGACSAAQLMSPALFRLTLFRIRLLPPSVVAMRPPRST
jgi:hypothetical protein